eukprot:TRINITY_DN1044_c0_g1_i3.p1 TRINITY_DN1044_c0_g1~~TRINITY_DN1044_c0_g1_i3.p1  ORF type:complete len:684 (+),score=194.90 TRINITY_DN1044_c0_g1_i3:34-2052(+)
MSDPFSSGNPFGGGGGGGAPATQQAPKPAHADPYQEAQKQPSDTIHFADDPFGSPNPPRSSAAQPRPYTASTADTSPPKEVSPFMATTSEAVDSFHGEVKHAAATIQIPQVSAISPTSIRAAVQEPGSPTSPASPTSSGSDAVEKQSIGDWKYEAIENCYKADRFGPQDIKAMAINYAQAKRIPLDPSLVKDADADPSKLTDFLRLTKSGFTYEQCNRVEVEDASRNPGKGMELSYWTYAFKVHTTLPQYKNQPHQDGQKEDTYAVIKNLMIFTVERRYRDFEWLRKALVAENPGLLVPPIPEKTLSSMKEKLGKKEDTLSGKDLSDGGKDKGKWQADEDARNCTACGTGFGLMTRKHHCRNCMKIFCSTCCPKPKGNEKRLCAECASIKGIGDMLTKNPEIAFRMKALHMFLSACFNGPLAYSPTLQFFIEAPATLLNNKKDAMLKKLETDHMVCSKSASDVAREKLGGVQSLWSGPNTDFTGLSPRSVEWRHNANRLHQHIEGYTVLRDQLSEQLFEGLKRKKSPVPELPKDLANDPELRAITKVTDHIETCATDLKNFNKECLFLAIATASFLIGLHQSMIHLLEEMEKYSKMKKNATKNPERMGHLSAFLDEKDAVVRREMDWLMYYTAVAFKQVCVYMWRLEKQRDMNEYDWEPAKVIIDALKDPKF